MIKLFPRFALIILLFLFSSPAFSYHSTVLKVYLETNAPPTDITFSGSITENINYAGVVGRFTTTDADAEEAHIYTLVKGKGDADNDKFLIIENELEIHTWPNYEIQKSYHIRVRTSDQKGGMFEKEFIIPVKEYNDAPHGIYLSTTTITENNPLGALVGLLTTFDEDTVDSHTYRLVAGNGDQDNASFTIANNELRVAKSFDYEIQSSYHIRLQVRDKGNLTRESSFIITVQDQVEVEPEKQEAIILPPYEPVVEVEPEKQEDVALPQEEQIQVGLSVYPNPAKEYLHLSCEAAMAEVHLVNSGGQKVLVQRGNSKQMNLVTHTLSSGVYTALIYTEKQVFTQRIAIVK